MPGRGRKLIVTERRRAIPQTMIRSRTRPQAVAQRAWMKLLALDQYAIVSSPNVDV